MRQVRRPPKLDRFTREEFVQERFRYRKGEHVTFAAPTGDGKTQLGFELEQEVIGPKLPLLSMLMKPRDDTFDAFVPKLGVRTVHSWPAPWWQRELFKGNGWILHPHTSFEPDVDEARQYQQFRRAILWAYRKGNFILDADECYGLCDLGLDRELKHIWTRGRSQGVGLWAKVQKPTHVPLWAYNCAEHLFLGPDPHEANIKKFAEFGGIDPEVIFSTIPTLGDWEHLYLRRSGRVACIVEA